MHAIRSHLQAKKHLIWDWNGTLLDDFALSLDSLGAQLEEHGFPRISAEVYRDSFRFPIRDYYRELGFDFARTPFESLSDDFIARYRRDVLGCRLFHGTSELLAGLREEGYSLSILSAAREEHLDHQVRHFGIRHLFDHVYGLPDHYAASKIERGRELMTASGFDPGSTLLIGDTDHDLAVAHALGVEALLLADGHQSYDRLSKVHSRVLRTRSP